MKVYIAPCGLGLGHIARCEPIARRLTEKGATVVFSTYLDGLQYAQIKKFRTVETIPISFKVRADGSVDFKRTASSSGFSLGVRRFLRQILKEVENIASFRPDIIVSDSRASSIVAATLLGVPTILLLNQFKVEIVRRPSTVKMGLFDRLFFFIANIFWIFVRTLLQGVWALSDTILIPDFPLPYTIALGNLAIPKKYQSRVRLIGPIVEVKPDQLTSKEEIRKKLGFNSDRHLIYAAVSGPRVERRYLANKLLEILRNPHPDYQIVLSKGEPSSEAYPKECGGVMVYDWIDDLTQFELLKACDLLVCRAGHGIVTKAMTYGKPLILIPIPDQTEQYGNANRAVRLGVAEVIMQSELNEENLFKAAERILNSDIYEGRAQRVADMAATLDATKTAIEVVEQLASRS